MISGVLAISIAFIAAAVSSGAYWLYYKNEDPRFLQLANRNFFIMGAGILVAAVLLYIQIFTHNFQLNYVYSYTSLKLSTYYLISTFWAGQEGTFLLWLIFGTVYGFILIKTVGRKKPLVLAFVVLVQLFILLILLKKNPFVMLWQVHTEVPVGFMPADGAGLNPLLQNPWMVIHPPIMFMGYSSTVVAFAFALNAMVTRTYHEWTKYVRPWVIFTVLALGTGIIMGGYWSYVTLGWGGYWAWDPVENASFVPWLFSAVLLHGVIIQNRQKGLGKTNLFLAGLAFIAVLWGSFLTRSGVLADFSVHSFAESGLNWYLIGFVGVFSVIFISLFIRSSREIDSPRFAEGLFSRETFILIGMLTLLFTGLVVFAGTSSPLYTGLFGKPANVSQNFYNTISIPVVIFLLLSMAIAPLLVWKVSELRNLRLMAASAVAAIVIGAVAFFLGMNKPLTLFITMLSIFAVLLNGVTAFNVLRKIPQKSGAYLAHVGIALMVIGIITSSVYDRSEKITLPAGEFQKSRFGYELQFVKFEKRPDGRDRVQVMVKTHRGEYEADPQFYYSNYTKSYMLSPHVKMGLGKDIYISPISFMPAQHDNSSTIELSKKESKKIGGLNITFNRFIVSNHTDQSPMNVKADLTVQVADGNYQKDVSIQPAMWMSDGQLQSEQLKVPGTDYEIKIESISAETGSIKLDVVTPTIVKSNARDKLAVEISEKPVISMLWFGTLVMIAGVLLSLIQRTVELKTRKA